MPIATRLLAAAVAPTAALALAAPAGAYDRADLRAKLAAEMSRAGPSAGAIVRDLRSGDDLYARRPDAVRIPASINKLYTTSAALLRLGPATTLDTLAATTAAVGPDGMLDGDLHLVGGGDPFFGAAAARRLATAVRAAGVRRVTGRVIGDERLFDERRSAKAASYDFEVGGVLSALAYDRGIAAGRAQTRADTFAARRFSAVLSSAGVRQGGTARAGATPSGAIPIAKVASEPVRTLARSINVPSNNFAAEMLLKGLGARSGSGGTTRRGAAAARAALDDLGLHPRIADGSGLSRRNLTTPRQVVRLLERMDGQEVGASFRASMATVGQTGTLRRRMRGTPAQGRCRAKTGTLRGVTTLAGYCRTRNGRELAFAFLLNGISYAKGVGILDRMAAAVARVDEDDAPPAS